MSTKTIALAEDPPMTWRHPFRLALILLAAALLEAVVVWAVIR